MAPRIVLGCVFAPPEDPVPRLLVTRHWPRGIAPGSVDQWEPLLGPAPELAAALARGDLDNDGFAAAYRAQVLARPALLDWAARIAANTGVVILGESRDEAACHRGLLAALLRERLD